MTNLSDEHPVIMSTPHDGAQRATFAAGCFWGIEAAFRELDGVLDVTVGYTGGAKTDPTYEQVCGGSTGHAEAVEVIFDPATVSYVDLLYAFWHLHNPTTLNRQGWDLGSQYRSAIFFHDPEQERLALSDPRRRAGVAGQADRDRDRPGDDLLPSRGVSPALLRALRRRVWGHHRGAGDPLRIWRISAPARAGGTARAGHEVSYARDAGGF